MEHTYGHENGLSPDARPADTRAKRRFLAFMLIVTAMYAFGVNSHWWYARDTVRYMGLARSLAETGEFSINGEPHTFALPGFPLMLSVIYGRMGENFLVMNIFMAVCGIACVAVTYLLFDRMKLSTHEKIAILLLFGFSRTLYYYSRYILTDVPFTLAATAGLYCGLRMLRCDGSVKPRWAVGTAVTTCAASAIRPVGPIVTAAIIATLWLRPGALKRWGRNVGWTALLAGPLLAAALVWAYRTFRAAGEFSVVYFDRFIAERGPKVVSANIIRRIPILINSFSDTLFGTGCGMPVDVLLLVIMAIGLRTAWRRGERLLCAYGTMYMVSVCVATPGRRYLLPVLAVLFYWLVLGTSAVGRYLVERRGVLTKRRAMQAAGALFVFALGMNVLRIGKVILTARTPDFYSVEEEGRLPDYFDLSEWMRRGAAPDDRVLIHDVSTIQYFGRVKIHWFRVSRGRGNLDRQIRQIRSNAVSFMVKDPSHEPSARVMDELVQAQPRAFRKVRDFGDLELFRVFPHALREPAKSGGRRNGNGEALRRNGSAEPSRR